MNKAREGKGKILTSIISVAVVAAIALGLVKLSSVFSARFATKAIQSGEIVLNSPEDINKYFVFLEKDEAASLLKGERATGKTVFLFPRVDLNFNGEPIIIKRESAAVEAADVDFITFSGLSVGTKVYSGGENAIIGGLSPAFAWFTERAKDDPGFAQTTYIAVSPISAGIIASLSDTYQFFSAGDPLASLNVKTKMTTPIEAQIAVSITDGNRSDYAVFSNMLRKNGKFVMLKK